MDYFCVHETLFHILDDIIVYQTAGWQYCRITVLWRRLVKQR